MMIPLTLKKTIIIGWPGCSLSSTSSLPSEDLLYHPNARALDKVFSQYTSHKKLNISVAVFLRFTNLLRSFY
jgi:hypothetical protein